MEPYDDPPVLTAAQLRDLCDLEFALTDTQARFDAATADAKAAKTDRDAARQAVLEYLHKILQPAPSPLLALFDNERTVADERESQV